MMGPLLDEGFDDLLFIGSEHTEYGNSGTKIYYNQFFHIQIRVLYLFFHTNFSQFWCCIS